MKIRWMFVLVALIAMATPAAIAQKLALDVDTKDLAARAIETVEVTLDGPMLKAASRFLSSDAGDKDVAKIVRGLEGIYVRSYTFAKEGEYDRALIQKFRSRIGPGWQKIVNVQSAGKENVEIYAQLSGEIISGMVIIAAEPKELTFVNIVGPLDFAELGKIEGQLGIPRISEKKGK
jgi:hypothetical protein